jgi:glycosyltransferase involved in cell wall biosynthesis
MNVSICTSTLNSSKKIVRLIQSLDEQSDNRFDWIVCDGGSHDDTEYLVKGNIFAKFYQEIGSGIYGAMNRAVEESKSDFYVVAGDDDEFLPDAINLLNSEIEKDREVDIFVFDVLIDGEVRRRKGGWIVWRGVQAIGPAHSVGMAIRKSLHNNNAIGMYNAERTIAADQEFILKAWREGATIKYVPKLIGKFSTDGVSSVRKIETLKQWYTVQKIIFPKWKFVLLIVTWIAYFRYIARI